MKVRNLGVGAGILMFALSLTAAASTSDQSVSPIEKKVSHELNMLPYSNVFDYMTFSVDQNGKVTLNGKVTNPEERCREGGETSGRRRTRRE